MSGFAVASGNSPDRALVDSMMKTMAHRGPHGSGAHNTDTLAMAQNYLRADGPDMNSIPLSSNGATICYDGQMGNRAEIAADINVPDGPAHEERLVLELYKQKGPAGMFDALGDTIFSFVIADGGKLLAARDLLGIKTLFYGRKNGVLFLAPELKALAAATDDINEFPPGHYMDETGALHPFAALPDQAPPAISDDVDTVAQTVRDIIWKSITARIDFSLPTASLLSGGIDSSVVATLGNKMFKEKFGDAKKLKTFSLGVGVSKDIECARLMSGFLGTDHTELLVDINKIMDVLPDVIYHLESFDPSLVRSAAANYLISREAARQGVEVLLSGEGGDEVFCGYMYLKEYAPEEQFAKQMECLKFLHSNASLRLDRMNSCNSVKVVAPLISGELLNYSMTLPPDMKQKRENEEIIEKWIFRKAYEDLLPKEIVWRLKQEFSQGSGSADVMISHFDDQISDDELKEAQSRNPVIRSKEELFYFRIFTRHFSTPKAADTVGQWIRL